MALVEVRANAGAFVGAGVLGAVGLAVHVGGDGGIAARGGVEGGGGAGEALGPVGVEQDERVRHPLACVHTRLE